MKNLQILLFILIGCALLLLQGCAAAIAMGGTAFFVETNSWDLNSVEEVEYDDMLSATEKAINESDIEIVETTMRANEALIIGENPDGEEVKVKLEGTEDGATKICIRIHYANSRKEQVDELYESIVDYI